MIELLTWLLSLFSGAVLSAQIAYESNLFEDMKLLVGLSNTQKIPNWKYWFKPIGFFLNKFKELVNCPFCTSMWIGTAINSIFWNMDLSHSLLFGLLTIPMVYIYKKISG
jgi:hypothetical protein